MGTALTNMTNDFIAEFTLMNNQVYPYVEEGHKTCILVRLTNSEATAFTVDSTIKILFDDGLGYTYDFPFYAVLIDGPIVIPAAEVDPQDPSSVIPVSKAIMFETPYTGVCPITSSDHGTVYQGSTPLLNPTVEQGDAIPADKELLYYFTFRMTEIIAKNIDSAHLVDQDSGDENPGYGPLTITWAGVKAAIDYGYTNMDYMNSHPSTSNAPITGTLSRTIGGGAGPFYLDYIVGDFFYYAVNDYYYNYTLEYNGKSSEQLCAELNALSSQGPPYVTANQATIIGAQMMAGLIDSYCNGAL